MRILVEEYQYNVADVKEVLHGIDALENVEGKCLSIMWDITIIPG